jgi:peptidoglycan-N-acetylglucosamine deacetylase
MAPLFHSAYICGMFYMVKTPWWLKRLYPSLTWDMRVADKTIFLSFDDGPHPEATPFVLDQLAGFNAKATFFCIGKNVVAEPLLYQRIVEAGHAVGNHTYDHLNGWKTDDKKYFENITEAAKYIDSDLFRPPYGRITKFQMRHLPLLQGRRARVIMWDVLSADFDTKITGAACLRNTVLHTRPGSVIVFHDSAKALPRLEYALPRALEHFTEKGFRFGLL